jgi:hypothetical protein
MWSSVLVMALGAGLLTGFDPMRLGITLLVISRPRPVQNLLAYGVGNLIACLFTVVLPLTVLHVTPAFKTFVESLATSSIARHIQVGIGLLALFIAAVLIVRSLARRGQRTRVMAADGNTLVLDSGAPSPIERLLGRAQNARAEGGSAISRLFGRAYNAWENGSLWISWVIGLASGPPLDGVLFLIAFIVASGVAIGAQASAAIAFVVGMLAVVELTLVCYLAKPARTQAIVQRLHDWARAHRQKILIAMCTVGGVALLAGGVGG